MSESMGNTGERRDSQTEPTTPGTPASGEDKSEQRVVQTQPAGPSPPIPGDQDTVWVRIAPSQVVRTIVIALLTAVVVLGALFLLWQVRTLIGWFVIALFLAAGPKPPGKL